MDTSECITCPTDAVSECFIIMPVGKNVKNFGNKVNKDEEKKEIPASCIQKVSCHSHAADTTHGHRNPAHTMAAFHAAHLECHRQTASYSRL